MFYLSATLKKQSLEGLIEMGAGPVRYKSESFRRELNNIHH